MAARSACIDVPAALLQRWPLPQPDDDADKEARGRVLVVGGARETPGGVQWGMRRKVMSLGWLKGGSPSR